MKNTCPLLIAFFLLNLTTLFCQIKMGNHPLTIDPYAIFEIETTQQGILLPRMTTKERDEAFLDNIPNALLIFNKDIECFEVYLSNKQKWEPIRTVVPDIKIKNQILSVDNGNFIDLGFLLDNTDHQKLELTGSILRLEGGGSVDLNPLFSSENKPQKLSLQNNILSLDRGGSVDLSEIIPATLPQQIDLFQLSSNTLTLSLSQDQESPHQISLDQIDTDHQSLTLSNTTLSLSRGGSVDLTPFQDEKDQQKLILSIPESNTLAFEITNGNTVMLENDGFFSFGRVNSNTLSILTPTLSFETDSGVTSNQSQNWESNDFVFGSTQLDNNPNITKDNKRIFFDKDKGAFRVGIAQSDQWDDKNRGTYSVAMGRNTIASGFHATAFGLSTTSDAWYSTSMGVGTVALSRAETALGSYNTEYDPAGGNRDWNPTDRLFVIGNGTGNSTASRTDALVMLKNGNTVTNGIWSGTSFNILVTPNQKAKVKPLKSSINKLKKLNVYQYKIKQRSRKTQFGFNVEEMKRLFPNLVYESDSIKSIDYMGLIPVLLNALLELQQELNQIKKELK